MAISHASFVVALLLIGCTKQPEDVGRRVDSLDQALSGPGWCIEMTEARERELKSRTDVTAYRELREFYADCFVDPAHKKAELLAAARRAAELGDESDRQEYAGWQMTFGSSSSSHAP